jgi:hypothetical protein
MKKLIFLSIIIIPLLISCSHQLKPFAPNKTFQNEQPNYLKNGEYNFSSYTKMDKEYIPTYISYEDCKYSTLNSDKYPVRDMKFIEKNLPVNLNCYLLFPKTMDEYDENLLKNNFFRAGYKTEKQLSRIKNSTGSLVKTVLINQLKARAVKVPKVQNNMFDIYKNVEIDKSNIFLKLVLEEEAGYVNRRDRNHFPAVIRYSLHIYDYKFDSLKKYNQVGFFKGTGTTNKQSDLYHHKIIASLLGQFSNDIEFLNFIKNREVGDITEFDKNLIAFKKNEEYKRNLISSLAISFDLKDYAKALQESNAKYEFNSSLNTLSNQLKYSLNDVQTNREQAVYDAVGNAVFSILDDISRANQERKLGIDKETVKRMVANYQEINKKQIDLINYFSENKYLDMAKFNIDVAKDNSMLNAFQSSINEGAVQVQNQLDIRGGITKNDLKQNQVIITNGTKINTPSKTPETSAIKNDFNASPNAPECNRISAEELKTSQEYRNLENFKTEGGSLGAKEQRVQAKLMQLTLKNCRSQLTPKEIQVLEDAIRKAIQSAIQMEEEFKKSIKMNLKN